MLSLSPLLAAAQDTNAFPGVATAAVCELLRRRAERLEVEDEQKLLPQAGVGTLARVGPGAAGLQRRPASMPLLRRGLQG